MNLTLYYGIVVGSRYICDGEVVPVVPAGHLSIDIPGVLGGMGVGVGMAPECDGVPFPDRAMVVVGCEPHAGGVPHYHLDGDAPANSVSNVGGRTGELSPFRGFFCS